MSRIGKKPIVLTDKVKVEAKNGGVEVTGPLGTFSQALPAGITIKIEKNELTVSTTESDNALGGPLHGLSRTLISNAVIGVTTGFKKDLEIVGLGYRAAHTPFPDPDKKRGTPSKRGWLPEPGSSRIFLQIGFASDVEFHLPPGIKTTIDPKQTAVSITGVDAATVGEVAARIRRLRKPEPYKQTGIRYAGEHIIKKAGKAAAGAVGAGAGGKK